MEAMRVDVRLFAILRERAGRDTVAVELEPGATVADAIGVLSEHAALRGVLDRLPVTMAVNRDYADPSTELHSGDELALIPPVSGGAGTADVHARISAEALSLDAVSALVGRPGAGAIVSFQGVTRDVESLEYEAYAEMAEERIASILADCRERHGLEAIAAEHRTGTVPLGEPSVVVAAAAAHRGEAFAGACEAIDRIKAEAPIWKREIEGGEARWVEGTTPA
ncbi:MAG: molybdenum cofactor biosynthesis protein MoaE [Solirubrobacterales bacterium]